MLKTSRNTKSITRPGKNKVRVDDSGGYSGDSDRKYSSDAPKLICSPMSLTLMLKTSSATDSSNSMTQIVVKYDRVDNNSGHNDDFDMIFQITR